MDRELDLNWRVQQAREKNMRRVITGNLNGNAYQFEEEAFGAVQAYLGNAAARFANNPDRTEIMADLEQAIADKCDTFLGRHKTVISVEEVRQILREMGPVDSSCADPAEASASAYRETSTRAAPMPQRPRRLYRLPGEGMVGGVCSGLAAYLNVDVVWVRLAYVLLAISTFFWFVVWLIQLCITPKAVTHEEIAAAHGDPISADEVMDHARRSGRRAAEALKEAGQNLRNAFGR
jgi:phage shock protein PspC (stress-responsive transcriptional regulator)